MTATTSYASLYPKMQPELPNCPEPVIKQALQWAARDFCIASESWVETLDAIPLQPHKRRYSLDVGYLADVWRLRKVMVSGNRIPQSGYDLVAGNSLEFDGRYTFEDVRPSYLECGPTPANVAERWREVLSGGFCLTVNNRLYVFTGLDFSDCQDMDDVLGVLQDMLHVVISDTTVEVRYSELDEKFAFFVKDGEIDYLSEPAHITDVDISGSLYLNGEMGASSLLGAAVVTVSLVPHPAANGLAGWFVAQWGEVITSLAMANLLMMSAKPWTSMNRAAYYLDKYNRGLGQAKVENDRKHKLRTPGFSA